MYSNYHSWLLFWFDIRVCQTKFYPSLLPSLGLIPALLCLCTELSGAGLFVCLFHQFGLSQSHNCLFVCLARLCAPILTCWPFACLFVPCAEGFQGPACLFVCSKGAHVPLSQFWNWCTLLGASACYWASIVHLWSCQPENLPPRLCICLTNCLGKRLFVSLCP